MAELTVPDHLQSSYRMVKGAFPEGLGREDYLVLLSILHGEFSQRNLAELMTHCFAVNYYDALNDVYFVGSEQFYPDGATMERIKNRLIENGYLGWLEED